MAFTQFHRQQYVRIADSNSEIRGGYFDIDEPIELAHGLLTIYINGQLSGGEQMRLKLYGSSLTNVPIASSDWVHLSDIGAYASNWIGSIYFDFDRVPLNAASDYYFSVEFQNYTRNGLTFYIGCVLDWYSVVNTQISSLSAGFRVALLGYK